MRNLERDVSVIGITEEMDRFFVLIAICIAKKMMCGGSKVAMGIPVE